VAEPVGIHADVTRLLRGAFASLFLLFQCLVEQRRVDRRLLHQDLAERTATPGLLLSFRRVVSLALLARQGALDFLARQRTDLDQHLPDRVNFGSGQFAEQLQVLLGLGVGRKDGDVAVVLGELEDLFDGLLVGVAVEEDAKAQVAALRVEGVRVGQAAQPRQHLNDIAHGPQIAQEGQRVHAVAQRIGLELQ